MKKAISLGLALVFAVSLTACGNVPQNLSNDDQTVVTTTTQQSADTTTENATVTTTKVADTTVKKPVTTKATAKATTKATTKAQPTKPAKLNPKTDFKFGKYQTGFYSADKQTYYKVSIRFYKDFEGTDYSSVPYFTEAKTRQKYAEFGMDFDAADLSEFKITVSGVDYYYMEGFATNLPESYKLTDTAVLVQEEGYGDEASFTLNANGTLTVTTPLGDRYGKAGTVYTFVGE
jgi:uncharacterized protein YcfL